MRLQAELCIFTILRTAAALQGSNFNVTAEFANAHGCNQECQMTLNKTNIVDLDTFGHDFDFEFYTTASNFTNSKPGDLLKIRAAEPKALQVKAGTTIYRFQYTSQDLDDSPVPANGFIAFPFAPTNLRANSSAYPLVAYAHGTSGIYRGCAPSNGATLYDYDSWQLLVQRGYAVVATDYVGLGNNHTAHKYCSFPAQAKDTFYSVAAARKAFSIFSEEWMAVGHSEGGGAVWKLAESDLVKSDKSYLGTVSLAPAVKIADMLLNHTDFILASGYLTLVAKALQRVMPSYGLTILGDTLRKRMVIADTAQPCLVAQGAISVGLSKDQILSSSGFQNDLPLLQKWQNDMAPASGGHNTKPILVVQGLNDTAVVPAVTRQSWEQSCSDKNEVILSEYAALDHSPVIVGAAAEWLAWVDARFKGEPTSGKCMKLERKPLDPNFVVAPPEKPT
ncbi:hypothetical protein QQS21_000782 [Conoideocrella luteorostrata]|uniref:Serine aminopeptidase S33 domain-containing protein n=1 Tax=Conoideocrella luteorostrata TaxID=1105319 RepID=A0AAJ0CYE0_9HYPO|nr:hypothetical protein QQS21_000782 [Conoideocrella luteorostrata]